jgi:uncharacterized protein YndB with AHSA1/START domain
MTEKRNPTTITAQPGTPFVDVVREFDATPAQVFRAATDPRLLPQWLGPRELETDVVEYDVRPGGTYRYVQRDGDGNAYGFRGVFHSVTANERVIQTFEYEGAPGFVSLENATYEDIGGRTRLHTHSTFPSVEARDAAFASGMEHGLVESMDRLADLVAVD